MKKIFACALLAFALPASALGFDGDVSEAELVRVSYLGLKAVRSTPLSQDLTERLESLARASGQKNARLQPGKAQVVLLSEDRQLEETSQTRTGRLCKGKSVKTYLVIESVRSASESGVQMTPVIAKMQATRASVGACDLSGFWGDVRFVKGQPEIVYQGLLEAEALTGTRE